MVRFPAVTLVALAAALVCSSACGGDTIYVECPPGTEPRGSECVPWGTPDATADVTRDVTKDDGKSEFPTVDPDIDDGDGADAAPPKDVPKETAPDPGPDVPEGPAIGDHCAVNADCGESDGLCLSWPGGYCSTLDCDVAGCADGASCVLLPSGNKACLRSCADASDCLGDGTQACKALPPGPDEAPIGVCYGVDDQAEDIGAPCGDAVDCLGPATCLASMPGGYCAVIGCEQGACPEGASCVKFDGAWTCLESCSVDAHCHGEEGAERQCADLKQPDKSFAGVCVSGAEGKPVGQPCQSGVECSSGFCEILGEGRCSQTQVPCFTEADCNGAEFCTTGPDKRVGICSAYCSIGTSCPGQSHCIGQPGAAEGVCRAGCTGVNDQSTCVASDGLACVFGYPLGDTTGQGKYACQRVGLGAVGEQCEEAADCMSSTCGPVSTEGYGLCLDQCGSDFYCPFPGTCVTSPTEGMVCHKACFSAVDCPTGYECALPQGSTRKVCQ